MASIKGVTLKAIKSFNGHDGQGFNANIYLDNKKIGEISDDGWGGGYQYDFNNKMNEAVFKERMKAYFNEYPSEFEEMDIFIYDILSLVGYEQAWKKAVKGKRPLLIVLESKYKSPIVYQASIESQIEGILQEEKPDKHTVFRSLEDFIIR